MAKVKATVLQDFSIKGEPFVKGQEMDMPVEYAARHEKLGYIKVTREQEKKIEAHQEKVEKASTQEKSTNTGPNRKK